MILGEKRTIKWIRLTSSDTWHFHRGCQWFKRIHAGPAIRRKMSLVKPGSGEFCDECRRKDAGSRGVQGCQ